MDNKLIALKYFLTKDNYLQYRNVISLKDSNELNILYKQLDFLFEKYPEQTSFSLDEFILFVKTNVQDDIVDLLLDQLTSLDVSDTILSLVVETIVQRQRALDVALLATDVFEGKKDYSLLVDKIKEEQPKLVEQDDFVTSNLEDLYEHNVKKQGLRWRLKTLNEMLGSLRQGDFGFIFARPETGKTTFLASEVSFFAEQSIGPILWFNNEEQGEKVMLRCIQASLGCSLPQLFADRATAQTKYLQLTNNNVKIIDRASLYKRDVERICERVKPSLIIFDQVDKVKGFEEDREDLRLGAIYIWARELAKTYCPVIGVCQADASAEGKKWLTMENVANAKTSKQAEADWILGIGKTHEPGLEYIRYLHLSKNKLAGDEDTIPDLRHGRRDVRIFPEIARYGDI